MRNALLGFVLGLATATTTAALAADRSSDWILNIDRATVTGQVLRRLSYAQHVDIDTASWPGMRAAAATNLPTLDAWMQQKGWGVWWLSFSVQERESARQAVLLGQ